MFVLLCILILVVWAALAVRDRRRRAPKLCRRDRRALKRDLERDLGAWQQGERPQLGGER